MHLIVENVKDKKIIKHRIAMEAIIKCVAKRLGESIELQYLIRPLHDIDYDQTMITQRGMERRGLESLNILKSLLPEAVLQTIVGHNEHNEFVVTDEYAKKVLCALRASDHVSELITVTALVTPSKKLEKLNQSLYSGNLSPRTLREVLVNQNSSSEKGFPEAVICGQL